jgi:large subunit ribosomal protein L10
MAVAVSEQKIRKVEELASLMTEYPVIGVVNMEGIPARQLQKMRALLRGDVAIRMSKKSLMQRALEKVEKKEKTLGLLKDYIRGQPAYVFSKINPFKLYRILESNKASAPIKGNAIAPREIRVQKGETPFPPGPLLGELQQVGIPTTIVGGKIAIKEDTVVARAGEKVSPKLAGMLARLGIEPMEIGLDLMAVHEGGTLFLPETLAIDEEKVLADLQSAFAQAVALSSESGYLTRETAPHVMSRAYARAKALAMEANLFVPAVMTEIVSKAYGQMLSLASLLKEGLDEDLEGILREKGTPAAAPSESVEEEKEETEEKSEEEALSGLGSLFG